MSDHVHILINLNPSVAPATLIQQVKGSSSKWMKTQPDYLIFGGWGRGYFATSISPTIIESCQNYINNQEVHHGDTALLEEIKYLISRNGLEWYDDDWE